MPLRGRLAAEYDAACRPSPIRCLRADGRKTVIDPVTREERSVIGGRLIRVVGPAVAFTPGKGESVPKGRTKREQIRDGELKPSYGHGSFDPGVGKPDWTIRRKYYGGQ